MTKVCIRQAVASSPFPRWHLLTFAGPDGGESRGVLDMLAIRKDHHKPYPGTKRGDLFQIVLIQVKGGFAAKPTAEDGKRLQIVARRHGAVGGTTGHMEERHSSEVLPATAIKME